MALQLFTSLMVLTAGSLARELDFNNNSHPIQWIKTTYGKDNLERVEELTAVIFPHHVTRDQRIDWPQNSDLEERYTRIRQIGDEMGHLVGPGFSGPAEWFNMSPQNVRVNRHLGYQSINSEWYGAECHVRKFLEGRTNDGRSVSWKVTMSYKDDSNRPDSYLLRISFDRNDQPLARDIDKTIHNPLYSEDNILWICRYCRSHRHQPGEKRQHRSFAQGCFKPTGGK